MISVRGLTKFFLLLALVLALLVFFVHAPKDIQLWIADFLRENAPILTSVGTLLLVGMFTIYATHLSNIASEERELNNRRIASELKKSDFRQQWINALRDDLSELVGLAQSESDAEKWASDVSRMKVLDARIRLRLKPDGTAESLLREQVFRVVDAAERRNIALASEREKLAEMGAKFIKDEWEHLKSLLEIAKQGSRQ